MRNGPARRFRPRPDGLQLRRRQVRGGGDGLQENRTGQIVEGYLADITVLDADLLTIDPSKIPAVSMS